MLSVIIATRDSERTLLPTLAALVPGATAGLVREVLVADGGSRDGTATVADVAGCNFLAMEGPLGRRLKAAAAAARAPWLLFLRPGIVLDGPWTGAAGRFVERSSPDAAVAVFRRGADGSGPALGPALGEAWARLQSALGARPRPDQGLIIAKQFYEKIGGHSETAADPEAELIRRLGRRRIVSLASAAFHAR